MQIESELGSNTQDLIAQFRQNLEVFAEKKQPNRWLIAHSGGLDSQVLLYLTARVIPVEKLLIIHVNHHLQPEANDWCLFSSEQAKLLKIPIQIKDAYPQNSSELAAREARYAAFVSIMQPKDILLLGHHADDQAETIIFKLLRGTGVAGLAGMPASRQLAAGWLFRPLLNSSRHMLQQTADELKLKYKEDPSNKNTEYDRNFIRQEILPKLKQRWPRLVDRFQDHTAQLNKTLALLADYLEQDMNTCLEAAGILNLHSWQQLPTIRQADVLRHWIYRTTGLGLNTATMEQINVDVINAKADAMPVFQLKQYRLHRFQKKLYLLKPATNILLNEIAWQTPKPLDLGDGKLVVLILGGEFNWPSNLRVKRRQGGESCYPINSNKEHKVKKLLQAAKIPPWQRKRWPLIYREEQLIAIPNICVCHGSEIEKMDFSIEWQPFSLFDND